MTQTPDKQPVSLTQPPAPPRARRTVTLPADTLLAGRYRLSAVIGHGGASTVYRAEDTRLAGHNVAIKEMVDTFTDPIERRQALEQFQHEGQLLATLDHPNLPRVSDYFSEGGRHYLVMELVDGRTLAAIQQEAGGAPLPVPQVLGWAAQLCAVLEYLHSHHPPIIFRDLKPDNIMLDRQGRIKLIDFGIVRRFDPAKRTDTLKMGTAGYAPPEQYGGRGVTDQRSDVYALGVTLYELLTGYDPATTPFALPPARRLNPAISPALDQVLAKAIQLDRQARWQSIGEMRAALFSPASPARPARPTRHLPMNQTVVTAQRIGFAGLLLGLAAIFAFVFVLISGLTIVKEVASGSVHILAEPVNGDVLIDGQPAGSTPLVLPTLLAGTHSIEVRAPEYVPYDTSIDLARGDTMTVTATLQRKLGSLTIDTTGVESIPVSATVSLNGKVAGVTPLRLDKLETGSYQLSLMAPHYKPLTQQIDVRWNETLRLSPVLEGLPATITLQVAPVDAEVWIDNQQAPPLTGGSVVITSVVPGPHQIRVQRIDYFRKNTTIQVEPDTQVNSVLRLDPLPHGTATLAYGRLGDQAHAGFLFSRGQVVAGNELNDFQFLVDSTLFNEVYKITTRDDRIVEVNQVLDQVTAVPETATYNATYTGPLQGRVFIVKTRDGKFAKIEITRVEADITEFRLTFRWVYQPDGHSFQ